MGSLDLEVTRLLALLAAKDHAASLEGAPTLHLKVLPPHQGSILYMLAGSFGSLGVADHHGRCLAPRH